MMLGDKVDAPKAEQWGMIYRSIPDEQYLTEAWQIAQTLAGMPTMGLAFTKRALQWAFTHTMYEQLQNEDKLQQRAAQTNDFKEGVAAFLEKRKPVFSGK